ncbi:signal recognition particle-docking protein FtsY [Anaerococcus hydrogenalis]|uniref:Signal recognition particle receptor FtsY n=1 Tax=Anaerococcus hydrogenalis ACS-025-V-Sch4 TaxID=879306 RepID=F0GZI5_9FIRM|nr:signal recognition particle-docking protein FtsY [Anaerococcus hydrogenalis]EGC84464.1 signal recognition particle-docking protein FtsY [Anaerococcus hydrogenalis ACS-025-V-Sch4]
MFDFFKRKKNENEKQVESELIEEVEDENQLDENEDKNINEVENKTHTEEDQEKEIIGEEDKEELGFFEKLSKGLTKTREQFSSKLKNLFTANVKIDDDLYDELEEILISADIGMQSTIEIVDELKDKIKERSIKNADQIFPLLKEIMEDKLDEKNLDNELLISNDKLSVILVIGVNGVGKTTTIGKLAHNLKKEGHKVTLAAADTFRAAAIEQLDSWAKESNTQMIAHKEGSDPSAVIFDAIQAAKANGSDVLICDTAGRLHNKKNLMNELEKINRTISTHANNANRENLLVLDATTGQNAISQLREFKNVCDITGLILTKLDGTAKGGVIFPLQVELEVPVKYIGVGEGIDNLEKFDSKSFVKAMIE